MLRHSSHHFSKPKQLSHSICFLLNGKLIELEEGTFDPTDSLVSFLRSENINLKGTKRGCLEGGCGSCTVILSSYNPIFERVKHRAVTSCLIPIANLHNTSITTIERLTQNENYYTHNILNPIQLAMKKHNATQCGFCTPGFIMSTLAFILENPNPTNEDLLYRLDGNICRCTGYRSIFEALREFTVDASPNDGIISGNLGNHDKISLNQSIQNSLKELSNLTLLKRENNSISIKNNGHVIFLPTTLSELFNLKKKYPKAKILVGNSELLISSQPNDKFDYISTNQLHQFQYIRIDETPKGRLLKIGPSTTIDDIYEFCIKNNNKSRLLNAFIDKISTFASNQTRSVASLIGNISSSSPSTDFTNFLPAIGAQLKVYDVVSEKYNYLTFDHFFTGYHKNILKDTEIVTEIIIPYDSLTNDSDKSHTDHVFVYKISNRREICGCQLSASIRADITEKDNIIKDIKIGFSKLSPVNGISLASKVQNFLIGKEFTLKNFEQSLPLLDEEFPLNPELDDGLDTYRRQLGHGILIKFYHQVQKERGKIGQYDESMASKEFDSTTFALSENSDGTKLSNSHIPDFSISCACDQNGTTLPLSREDTLKKSITHLSSDLQVQGQAEYTDDIPLDHNCKHAAFVTSNIAHGIIKNIDWQTEELKNKKFTVITANDISGKNTIGQTDEELLASKKVVYYGQPIAIVVADNEREAQLIASRIKVEYEKLSSITDIEESIKEKKFIKSPSIKQGKNVDELFEQYQNSDSVHILDGSIKMGGQYHIYLEPNASVTSRSSDGQYFIHPTCKLLTMALEEASKHLNVDENRINVNVKRIGGSFCGKGVRATIVSSATAIASQKLKCQVKMVLSRPLDIEIMSSDHNCLNQFRVAFDIKTGKIIALKMNIFIDGGFYPKSSMGLLLKTLLHADSAYNIPNLEINGFVCQTNKVPNAPFRGFGAQNGSLVIEAVTERIQRYLKDQNLPPDFVKINNFYVENDKTPYGVQLEDVNIMPCWTLIKEKSRYNELRKCVNAFNAINKYKKRGLAITPVKYGLGIPIPALKRGSCIIHLLKDGSVLFTHSGIEVGQGINTKMCSLISKLLDIPIDLVHVNSTDTLANSEANSTNSGMTNDVVGFAVIDACKKLNRTIQPYRYNEKHEKRPFKEVVNLAFNAKENLTAHGVYVSSQEGFNPFTMKGSPYSYYVYGAGVSLAEIDVITGEHKILESHIVFDAGESLNPGIDIGQVEGGFMQGLGWMSTEEIKYDKQGRPINTSMYKYKVPSVSCMPLKFSVHLLPNSHNKYGVLSSKGVGEPPEMLANCVGFALIDAIEAARKDAQKGPLIHYDFPLVPNKVHHYLHV